MVRICSKICMVMCLIDMNFSIIELILGLLSFPVEVSLGFALFKMNY